MDGKVFDLCLGYDSSQKWINKFANTDIDIFDMNV
ncbi:hypothetical protein DERF_002942 [Dermatophagoides farinae]|uniref:Uncharacterized protein n=1 Tax=Dermatophagoides farinae TaxID=6954 RepID=A0A922IG91_DERFA|nr:hypothetical protein DERF_002942 [Dermatophagoides farinae]